MVLFNFCIENSADICTLFWRRRSSLGCLHDILTFPNFNCRFDIFKRFSLLCIMDLQSFRPRIQYFACFSDRRHKNSREIIRT